MFKADFYCEEARCIDMGDGEKAVVHVETFMALVEGSGCEVHCPRCRRLYLVKEDGARLVNVKDLMHRRQPIDAVGKPFFVTLNDDPPIDPRLPGV
jgi:hypothetical protein